VSELRYILVGSKKEEFVDKRIKKTESALDNIVLGGFLTLFAVMVTLFAGTMGVMVNMPLWGMYSGKICKNIFFTVVILLSLAIFAYVCKTYFGFVNWQIALIFCLFFVSFVLAKRITKTQC
jgi:hypothetical protein